MKKNAKIPLFLAACLFFLQGVAVSHVHAHVHHFGEKTELTIADASHAHHHDHLEADCSLCKILHRDLSQGAVDALQFGVDSVIAEATIPGSPNVGREILSLSPKTSPPKKNA